MAKGVGLDAGEYEIKVVELDGSYRKPRLAKVSIDRVSQPTAAAMDEGHAAREAEAALQALRGQNVSRDNVVLGFPCREAVLRTIDVPFKGTDQIRKVIKFEVEDSIHSHNVDDMIVDFHVLQEFDAETRVLVAAVPKLPLRTTLNALEAMGVEPEVVDLDTMALYRVADWSGCFDDTANEDDDLAAEDDAASGADGGQRARVVIDVGARSTRVLAVVDGQIADMRALRVGVDGIADEIATRKGVSVPAAREAVFSVFDTGQTYEFDSGADDDELDQEEGDESRLPSTEVKVSVTTQEVSTAASDLLRRLHRELMRFVASMQGIDGVEAVYVTGGGSFLPQLDEVLRDIFGCTSQPLPVLEKLNHNLDEDEARWIGPRIAVAVGLALGSLGGVGALQFRQEDLAFQRSFDRVKFPLAIACMLAMFLLFIVGLRYKRQVDFYERQYGALYNVEEKSGGRRQKSFKTATFFGYVGHLMNKGGVHSCSERLDRKSYQDLINKVLAADTFDRLPVIERYLANHVKSRRQATGVYQDLQLPSGFEVIAQFCDIVAQVESELGSFIIQNMKLDLGAREPMFEFKIAVRGDGYRQRFSRLKDALETRFADPACVFKEWKQGKGKGEDPFQGEVPGAINVVRIALKELKR